MRLITGRGLIWIIQFYSSFIFSTKSIREELTGLKISGLDGNFFGHFGKQMCQNMCDVNWAKMCQPKAYPPLTSGIFLNGLKNLDPN